jgi:pyruvate dehydrogenase E2 component (dihydrolipoamide acetyltransferase)
VATKVHMEALSPTMEEGQLVQWIKAEGDEVSNGDVLAEIETDKATMELVARGDGILRKIFLGAGGTAPVGSVIAVIAASDEDISGIQGSLLPQPRWRPRFPRPRSPRPWWSPARGCPPPRRRLHPLPFKGASRRRTEVV